MSLSDHPSEKTRFRLRKSIQESSQHGINALLRRAREQNARDRITRAEEKAHATPFEKLGCTLTEKDQRIFPKWAEVMWGGVHVE